MTKPMRVSRMVAVVVAAAMGVGVSGPSMAAPVLSNAALRAAAPDHVTDVRWRRGPGIGAAIVGGIVLGSILASRQYGPGPAYYGPGYPDYGPAYAVDPPVVVYEDGPPVYAPAPGYYAPRYRCYRRGDDRYSGC